MSADQTLENELKKIKNENEYFKQLLKNEQVEKTAIDQCLFDAMKAVIFLKKQIIVMNEEMDKLKIDYNQLNQLTKSTS